MAIPFRCSSCGQEYEQPDGLAGTVARCKWCGEKTRVLPPAGRAAPVRPRGAAASLHAPDLNAAASLEPPSPAEAGQVELPRYAMDYIAPPPKVATKPRPIKATPPLPPAAPPSRDGDFVDLAAAPPPPLPTTIASATPMAPAVAVPRARRKPPEEKLDDVWLLLSDDVARLISALLLVVMLFGTFYGAHRLSAFISERANVPEELSSRLSTYMWLTGAWGVVLFALITVPLVLVACMLACTWTKWTLPERPLLRAAGAATLPALISVTIASLLMGRYFAAAIGVTLCAPFILVIGLKELMGLRWSATAVAALLLLVAVPVSWLITSPISWMVSQYAMQLSHLDPGSIDAWRAEHPDEARRLALQGSVSRERPNSNVPVPRSSTPAPPRDPLFATLTPYIGELSVATHQAANQTREQIKEKYDRLASQILPLKPEKPGTSERWVQVKGMLDKLEAEMNRAPSETPPPEVFRAIEEVALRTPRASAEEFQGDEFRLQAVRINPLKGAKVDVNSFLREATSQKWELQPGMRVALELKPLLDPKQQRPWLADRAAIAQLAQRKNLLCVVRGPTEAPTFGRIAGIGWTRIVHAVPGGRHGVQYVGRLPDKWLIVELAEGRNLDDREIALLDKFVQGISYAQDQATAEVKGPDDLITGVAPRSGAVEKASLGSGDVKALLAIVQSDASSWDKADALKTLAKTPPPDGATRDAVAGVLEQVVAADTAFIADDAADALTVWHRPGTVDVMLSLLAENVFPPSKRTRAMKILAATGEKRAVLPIMRWVLKDTEAVVAALSAMGPAAEDEAVARLREKEATARVAAARILSSVGTQKCLAELRRAAQDPRDPGAAAAARSALETVLARTKQAKAAATTPATSQPEDLTPR